MDLKRLPFDAPMADYDGQAKDWSQAEVARWYGFENWEALAAYVAEVTDRSSQAFRFERAVEAVVDGDLRTLEALTRDDPGLVAARSRRKHQATLLHYVAANGVEDWRQRSPKNAAAVAKLLLAYGAEVDARAQMYGGRNTTMAMLVSSSPPAEAGVQVALLEALLDFGADIEDAGSKKWDRR